MKTYLAIILFLGLVSVRSAHAVECNPEGNQAEMNMCSAEKFQKQDKELNRLYKVQMDKLENPLAKNRFKKAQQSWIKFRDASCLYEIGPREESGTIWPLLNLDCMTAFTKERIARLKHYVSCTDDQCPR